MLATLRQPKYLGLFGLMVVIAIICGFAGTWQIYRFEEKRAANHHLRSDYDDKPTSIVDALGTAASPISNGDAQKFRHITATGTYLADQQTLLRGQTIDSDIGYFVITPLKTADGVLLVARGFIKQNNAADTSPVVPAAPSGTITVAARLEPSDSKADRYGSLPGIQVDSIDPSAASARVGVPVWNAYAELLAGDVGTAGLKVIPDPDLSNPAGGAEEPQHLAYVVQWYLFALLALSAPFILARAERRREEAERAIGSKPNPKPLTAKERKASLDDRLAGRR